MENKYAAPSFLAKPPRAVPLSVQLRLLFGGFSNQFGWIFFGFGMIFVWIFGFQCDPMALIDFSGELETAQGTIIKQTKTNMSEGGNEHTPGTPIYLNEYKFGFENRTYEGKSYSLGRKGQQGQNVVIEFPVGRPQRSRIHNMRTAVFPIFVLFVFIFPLIGLTFVLVGMWNGRRAGKLLKIGEFTTGKLVSKEATNTKVNDQRVYKLSFEFQTESGETKTAIAKTHQTEKLLDDDREPLLYDPLFPDKATLLDHLPGSPQIDHHGQITAKSPLTTLLCLFIPTLAIVGHSIAFYFMFLK